jgi:hypothetical protein
MRTSLRYAAIAAAAVLAACRPTQTDQTAKVAPNAEPLHAAVQELTNVIVYDIFSPPQAARAYAYASIAAYETLRQGSSTHRTMAGKLNGLTPVPEPQPNAEYSLPLAGVHAFMTVSWALTFSKAHMDSVRSALDNQFRRTGISAPVFDRSVAYGEKVAQHILAWAGKDGYKESRGYPKYTVTAGPGRWIPTPPGYADAVEPHWATLRPFALDSASQYRPEPPHPYDSARTSAFFREAMEVYEESRRLTEDERQLVVFWDDNPFVMHVQGHTMFATKKATPGGHWMSIAAIASRNAKVDLVRAAEAYALTAIALADGFISCWEEKFRSNLVRPETVINRYIDPQWVPILQTPPFPEYTSGHSVISNAAAVVLSDRFGAAAFIDSSQVTYGLPVRSFTSFTEAASEAAISRLYGGIHYRRAIEQGSIQGRRVGEHIVRRVQARAEAPVVVAGGAAR